MQGKEDYKAHASTAYPVVNAIILTAVSGICNGVAKGIRRITYHVGPCEGESQHGDANTGWGSSFHIFMEEINLESVTTCQSGRPVVCSI